MGRLTGKTALISGTGAGIGRAAAQVFAEEGAAVFGCDINPESAAETVERAPSRNRGSARTRWVAPPPDSRSHRVVGERSARQNGLAQPGHRAAPDNETRPGSRGSAPGFRAGAGWGNAPYPAARRSSAPASRLSAATTRSRSGPSPASRSASTAS
ncbi:MAG: hypothetical protein QOI83_594 [Streptomycetaceae bacterium]|jgi:hypothetical protein|nr:hypothetical protein [Streptomycetaceae bacterium]